MGTRGGETRDTENTGLTKAQCFSQIIDTEMLKDMIQGVQILCIKRAIGS